MGLRAKSHDWLVTTPFSVSDRTKRLPRRAQPSFNYLKTEVEKNR